jgi:hypothetical protein
MFLIWNTNQKSGRDQIIDTGKRKLWCFSPGMNFALFPEECETFDGILQPEKHLLFLKCISLKWLPSIKLLNSFSCAWCKRLKVKIVLAVSKILLDLKKENLPGISPSGEAVGASTVRRERVRLFVALEREFIKLPSPVS